MWVFMSSVYRSCFIVKWCPISSNGMGFDVMCYIINGCWVYRGITAMKGDHFAYVPVSD